MSEFHSDEDPDPRYASILEDDQSDSQSDQSEENSQEDGHFDDEQDKRSEESFSDPAGMNALMELAAEYSENPEKNLTQSSDILSFSTQLMEISARLSQVSAEKLQVEFENRDLQTRVVPLQMEKKALVEETAFLKAQVAEFWAEIEKISKEKNDLFRERCEAVRKSVDEVTLVRSDMDSLRQQLEIATAEKNRVQAAFLASESEKSSLVQNWAIKEAALLEKSAKLGELVSVLEQKDALSVEYETQIASLKSDLGDSKRKNLDMQSLLEQEKTVRCKLETEKEELLQKIVLARDHKKSNQLVSDILGKTKWTLSELVDELQNNKLDIASKREEIDSLQNLVEEMRAKMPLVEANYARLQQCEAEVVQLSDFNETLKRGFQERETELEKLSFEKSKIETDYQSLQIRSAEFSRQIATLIHENELIRSKAGILAGGAARSHPRMIADSDSNKRSRMSAELVVPSESRCSFRTVLDLVEQNAELKQRVDNLLNNCETEAQRDLVIVRRNLEKLEQSNRDLIKQRETDRIDSERILSRIEREHRSAQNEVDRLKKLLEGDMVVSSSSDEHVLVLQAQLRAGREEWQKHTSQLSENNKTLAQVNRATLVELEKIRSDLQKELDQRIYFESMFGKMKQDVEVYYDRNKGLTSQLASLQRDHDSMLGKLAQMETSNNLLTSEKKSFSGQISSLKATIASLESSIASMARDKESSASLLMGYHQRLEQEAKIYQQNSEMLKKLYVAETEKRGETLSFYQTAYEEQVRRGTELSNQVTRLTSELDKTVLENSKLQKNLENLQIEKKISPPNLEKNFQLEHDCAQLRQLLAATESLADEYKTSVIPRLERELDTKNKEISDLQQQLQDVPMEEPVAVLPPPVDNSEAILFVTRQLDDAKAELAVSERNQNELSTRLAVLEEELSASKSSLHQLSEQARQSQLVATVKENNLLDQVSQLEAQLAAMQSEHTQLSTQLQMATAENEKYMAYFASDLGNAEKEEHGKSIIAQLQTSLSVHTTRETQLVSDLQRVRTTMDTLLHENRMLKSVVSERDELLLTKERLESNCKQFELRVTALDSLEDEKKKLCEEVEKISSNLTQEHQDKSRLEIELRGLGEKLQVVQDENSSLVERIALATRQAEEWKEMHANAASADTAQLEKAKNQLSQTVSKLREEAAKKTADIAALSAELKAVKAEQPNGNKADVKQLMALVVDYQSALAGMMDRSPTRAAGNPATADTPYHDPNEDVAM